MSAPWFQRRLPPVAAPMAVADLAYGFAGLWKDRAYRRQRVAELKPYLGVDHVWGLSSGKAALAVSLAALAGLSGRRRVIIPAYSCFTVPAALIHNTIELVVVDIDPETLDFDYAALEDAIDDQTLCVIPTHLFGLPADMDRVTALCRRWGTFVIEDAAQAMGGTYRGRRLGTLGDVGVFSFARGKHITCGSGGMMVTNSPEIARAIEAIYAGVEQGGLTASLRNWLVVATLFIFGGPRLYGVPASLPFLGLGETRFVSDFPIRRLDGMCAGLLWDWQARLEQGNLARIASATDLMARLGPATVIQSRWADPTVYLRLPLVLESPALKQELCARADDLGLGISPMYPSAIPAIPELRGRVGGVDCPHAAWVADRLVTLPVHPFVTERDRERLGRLVGDVVGGRAAPVQDLMPLPDEVSV